jgi:hypothetical protein
VEAIDLIATPAPTLPGRLATFSWEAALNPAQAHSVATATYCLEILFVRTGIAALVSHFMILTKDAPIIVVCSLAPETLALRKAVITLRSPESKRRIIFSTYRPTTSKISVVMGLNINRELTMARALTRSKRKLSVTPHRCSDRRLVHRPSGADSLGG